MLSGESGSGSGNRIEIHPVAGITIYYSQASMKVFLDLRRSLQTFRENILVFKT
jgi:hypothetical protein